MIKNFDLLLRVDIRSIEQQLESNFWPKFFLRLMRKARKKRGKCSVAFSKLAVVGGILW